MAQTKPKAAQFYGVSGNGTAGQVLISDGNGGMSWGANTEEFTVSWSTPTGQSLTYTQPSPQSSQGAAGSAFPTTTFTATKSGEEISGTATIAGLPTGITASQSLSGTGVDNVLTVTLTGVFPGADSLNTALTISGLTFVLPLIVDYLVVGGGASGGQVGGGGAGGYLTNFGGTSLALSISTNYAITVGGGGAGSASTRGNNGSDSIFNNITSTGGGGGGGQGSSTNSGDGYNGGSGGGAGVYDAGSGTPGNGNTPATNPSQGNNGGNDNKASGSQWSGGGGGGAGTVGQDASTSILAGDGGAGLANAITVASGAGPFYAAGGGGSSWNSGVGTPSAGTGGSSIGGNGGTSGSTATSGATNKGSGGGACGFNPSGYLLGNSGSGGSGVVILRYPNSKTITNPGSGLTFTTATVGSDKVTTFTAGTGNIQFN